ncbi:unnamed protein product [Prunus armeniaca]
MEDQSSLFCMRGGPSIFVWGGALQIQPPFWSFISSVLLSDVAFVCCCSRCASSSFSLHGFREEDLWKKNWSNQYENPQSAHQSGN